MSWVQELSELGSRAEPLLEFLSDLDLFPFQLRNFSAIVNHHRPNPSNMCAHMVNDPNSYQATEPQDAPNQHDSLLTEGLHCNFFFMGPMPNIQVHYFDFPELKSCLIQVFLVLIKISNLSSSFLVGCWDDRSVVFAVMTTNYHPDWF
jgi:hypothetical protein